MAAEAELISAIATFLEAVGLGPSDVAIKVSSRKVLQAVLERYSIPVESFGPVCIVIDKLDKLPAEKVGQPPAVLRTSILRCMCLNIMKDVMPKARRA